MATRGSRRFRAGRLGRALCLAATLLGLAVAGGCNRSSSDVGQPRSADDQQRPTTLVRDLLNSAVDLLQRNRTAQSYRIAAQQLNQYVHEVSRRGSDLIPALDAAVAEYLSTRISARQLATIRSSRFEMADSMHLESCFLARDIAQRVAAGRKSDLDKASALFDWLVCNVQISDTERSPPLPVHPRVTFIVGRGTEQDRAWCFMQLLRQAGIESVLLAYRPPAEGKEEGEGEQPDYVLWLPAALIDRSLYLFDTTLGLPVPGPGGDGVATLKQVRAQPQLLQQLDLGPAHPYRLRPEQLGHLVALLESTPGFWSPRMEFLQGQLAGTNRVVLWSDIRQLMKRLRKVLGPEVPLELWTTPLIVDEASRGNPQFAAYRQLVLRLMLPYLVDPPSMEARIAQLRGEHAAAIKHYMRYRLTPTPEKILAMSAALVQFTHGPPTDPRGTVRITPAERDQALALCGWLREDFTYFLGLLKYEQGQHRVAVNWLAKSYLQHYKDGRWTAGARFLLARCAEAQQQPEQAIRYYTADDSGPQGPGNLLRARRHGWQPGQKP